MHFHLPDVIANFYHYFSRGFHHIPKLLYESKSKYVANIQKREGCTITSVMTPMAAPLLHLSMQPPASRV